MDPATTKIIETLVTGYGLPGIVIVALAYMLHRATTALREEQKARIDDAKIYAKELLAVNDKVHQTTDRLFEMIEIIQPQTRMLGRGRLPSAPDDGELR